MKRRSGSAADEAGNQPEAGAVVYSDNCRSKNELVEKAINFYVDYLETQDSQSLLPTALLAALNDGWASWRITSARRVHREVGLGYNHRDHCGCGGDRPGRSETQTGAAFGT